MGFKMGGALHEVCVFCVVFFLLLHEYVPVSEKGGCVYVHICVCV